MDPEVIRYIAENRERYTREAIDAHLRRAGHTQADIDAAWSQAGQERGTPPADRTFWRAFVASVVAMYGLTFLVYSVSFYVGMEEGYESIALIISAMFLVPMLIAGLITLAFVRPSRSAGRGLPVGY